MGKFTFKKKMSLGHLGEEWKDCHIFFSSISYGDAQEIASEVDNKKSDIDRAEYVISILKDHFIEGKGPGGLDIAKDDLNEFPIEVITEFMNNLTGNASPKG